MPVEGKDKENQAIQDLLQQREAGVADLLDFYARVETVYVSASLALQQYAPVRTSNSANPE